MAWETVSYSCGHAARLQMYGPLKGRESKKEWLERSGLCPECYASKKQAEREAADQKARDEAAKLPSLEGSDKQVAWATKIRAMNHKHFAAGAQCGREAIANGHNPEENESAMFNFVCAVELCKSARWWIENRDALGQCDLGSITACLQAMARKWMAKEATEIAARCRAEIKNMQ